MIQTDDPLPAKYFFFASTQQLFLFSISTIIIAGCFLLISQVRAQEEMIDGGVAISDYVPEELCDIESRVRARLTQTQETNRVTDAICAHQEIATTKDSFSQALRTYTQGHPIAAMADIIADQDPAVAAYLIAMAKQESNWGKRVPVLNGQDCFNYWGFRSKRVRMGSGGHTCFDSPQDAVETVAARIHELVYDYNRVTPRQMLIWKCGRSCAAHDPVGVERWVSVVGRYYNDVNRLEQESKI